MYVYEQEKPNQKKKNLYNRIIISYPKALFRYWHLQQLLLDLQVRLLLFQNHVISSFPAKRNVSVFFSQQEFIEF